ncbi:MAG TPA: hypothetical protein VE710_20985 [Candidatus Bathyarchaeia archaeon]|nr:hypothetical protein [Candidatus Bathyarchaeia archaeon]
MKRSVTCLLATVLLVAGVVPVGDAGAANRSITAAAASATLQSQKNKATVKKPLHHQISFNDYQVVGLNENGWNWVRNHEFILPANTPLDIDMLQYTYSPNGKDTVNRKKVILDGTELVEYRGEVASPEQVLPWKVPRFTIPASLLSPGEHLLTFIAEDGNGQTGMVSVKFMVEEPVSSLSIYQGTDATGPLIPSGSTQTIFANNGSMKFFAGEQGTWKVYTKGSTTELKGSYGLRYNTGTLEAGSYEIVYKPLKEGAEEWRITLEIGLPPIYQIVSGNKQKIAPGQKITAPSVPGIIQLSADTPGRWFVNGTNQAAVDTEDFEVMLPETLRGMTVTVYYQPDGFDGSTPSQVQIDVPVGENPATNTCDPSQALATMDIMSKGNADSDLELEKINLKSSTTAIDIYQEPLHEIWITTSADHLEHGSKADEEEGPGIWAVNNVVVDATRLNWDHTGLNIAFFGKGTHNIRYISKGNTKTQWCGSIRIYEDEPPVLASLSCEADESGPSPQLIPIRLETDKGEELVENGSVEINSVSELSKYDALTMKANHVANYGTKRIKKGTKTNRSYLTVPDVRWEYDVNYFGEKQNFGGNIFSQNKVDILYEDKVIETIRPKSEREHGDKSGMKSLNLESIIKANDAKPGKYTIRITHELANNECKIDRRHDVDDKDIDRVEQKQVFSTSIVLK